METTDNTDVIDKAYLDEKLLKISGHIPLLEKDYNEFILHYNKQSVEQSLIRRTVKTTLQIFYDKGLFDNFNNADEVLKDCLFTREILDLEKSKWCHWPTLFININ